MSMPPSNETGTTVDLQTHHLPPDLGLLGLYEQRALARQAAKIESAPVVQRSAPIVIGRQRSASSERRAVNIFVPAHVRAAGIGD